MKRSRLIRLLQTRPRTAEWFIRHFGLRSRAVIRRLESSGVDIRCGWPTKPLVRRRKNGEQVVEAPTYHLRWWIPGPGRRLARELDAWGLAELGQHPHYGGLEDVKYARKRRG